MKQTGVLAVSLRVVNFGFWSRLECSDPGKAPIFQAAKVSFRVPRRNTELREEKQKSNLVHVSVINSRIITLISNIYRHTYNATTRKKGSERAVHTIQDCMAAPDCIIQLSLHKEIPQLF